MRSKTLQKYVIWNQAKEVKYELVFFSDLFLEIRTYSSCRVVSSSDSVNRRRNEARTLFSKKPHKHSMIFRSVVIDHPSQDIDRPNPWEDIVPDTITDNSVSRLESWSQHMKCFCRCLPDERTSGSHQ
ncbi:hypothetical protein TNCV_2339961 [Trichonephila clavipes]|nr:hypothetical protein TNCV_2339961 [Trichonephila clavipes]